MRRVHPFTSCLALALLASGAATAMPDEDDLQDLIDEAGVGGTVNIDEDYLLCKTVRPLEGQTLIGTGELIACAVPRTVLTVAADAGQTTITVADASVFDEYVGVGFGIGEGGLGALENCTVHLIQAITGDQVTFSNGLCRAYDVGTAVYTRFSLVQVNASDVSIRGIGFDGNESLQPAAHIWKQPGHAIIANRAHGLLLETLRIRRTWSDGLQLLNTDDATIRNVHFEDIRCAPIHLGTTNSALVEDSTFRNVGTQALACGHSEGAVTWSLNNIDLTVRRSCFEDVHNSLGVFARMRLAVNDGALIEYNRACRGGFFFLATQSPNGNITLTDNSFGGMTEDPAIVIPPDAPNVSVTGTRHLPADCTCDSPGVPSTKLPARVLTAILILAASWTWSRRRQRGPAVPGAGTLRS